MSEPKHFQVLDEYDVEGEHVVTKALIHSYRVTLRHIETNTERGVERISHVALTPQAMHELIVEWGRFSHEVDPEPYTLVVDQYPDRVGMLRLAFVREDDGAILHGLAYGLEKAKQVRAAIDNVITVIEGPQPAPSTSTDEARAALWQIVGLASNWLDEYRGDDSEAKQSGEIVAAALDRLDQADPVVLTLFNLLMSVYQFPTAPERYDVRKALIEAIRRYHIPEPRHDYYGVWEEAKNEEKPS